MCTIKTMIKIALGTTIAYCVVGVVKHVVCMITHIQSSSSASDLDSILDEG